MLEINPMTMSSKSRYLITQAYEFADQYHKGQVRKYTGEPYIYHPLSVARILSHYTGDENQIIAALLHDVVEDTAATFNDVRDNFGTEVYELVWWLTEDERGPRSRREHRKHLSIRFADAPAAAKNVKLADIMDNISSIVEHDPDFYFGTYRQEIRMLLARMRYNQQDNTLPNMELFGEVEEQLRLLGDNQ